MIEKLRWKLDKKLQIIVVDAPSPYEMCKKTNKKHYYYGIFISYNHFQKILDKSTEIVYFCKFAKIVPLLKVDHLSSSLLSSVVEYSIHV